MIAGSVKDDTSISQNTGILRKRKGEGVITAVSIAVKQTSPSLVV